MGRLARLGNWIRKQSPWGDAGWTDGMFTTSSIIRPDGKQELSEPSNAIALLSKYREWVYAAVNLNANGVASTPLRLYVVKRGGGKSVFPTVKITKARKKELQGRQGLQRWMADSPDVEEVLEHPFYDLWERGNDVLTGAQLKHVIVSQMDIVNQCFTYIPQEDGIPSALVPLAPGTMNIEVDKEAYKILGYTQKIGTEERDFDPEEIAHFKHPNPGNPFWGKGPLEAVGLAATLYHDFNIYESALMQNDAVPGIVLTAREGITESQRKRAEKRFNQKQAGKRNVGRVFIHSGELKAERIGLTQKEMSFGEGRDKTRREITGVFGVPEALLTSQDANRAVSHDAATFHARYAIKPRCILIEDQLNRDIIPLYDGDSTIFVAFDNPVPADKEYDLRRAQIMVDTDGIFRINEARKAAGEDALDEFGDDLIEIAEPPAPEPIVMPDEEPPPGEEEPEADTEDEAEGGKASPGETIEKLLIKTPRLEQVLRDLFTEQKAAILHTMGIKGFVGKDYVFEPWFDLDEWTRRFQKDAGPYIAAGLAAGMKRGAQRINVPVATFDIYRPETQSFIQDYTYRFSFAVNMETQKQLRNAFEIGTREGWTTNQMADEVGRQLGFAERYRSIRIARTETARSIEAGQVQAWKDSGVVEGYFWITTSGDPCEFCIEMENKFGESALMMKIGMNYHDRGARITGVDGGVMKLDYSDIPSPPLHANCRCDLIPVLIGG